MTKSLAAAVLSMLALSAHAGDFLQGPKLVGTGAAVPRSQAYASALSADGSTLLFGAIEDTGSDAGGVSVFTRAGGMWKQQGTELVGTGAVPPSGQGYSVALSADGNTAAVGAPFDASSVGAVWIFTRSNGVWSQQGDKLVGTGGVGASRQGNGVALSSDGNTLIEGGQDDASSLGAAWIFTRTNGVWSQQGGKLVGQDGTGTTQGQGLSVGLSGDGNTALIGGPFDASSTGAAWIFVRAAGVWSQQGPKLVGSGAAGGALQGRSVSLSADGNTAVSCGVDDDAGIGATWVFTRSGGAWSQQGGKLVGTGAVGPSIQGYSVALSSDGGTILVGGPADDSNTGAAWAFTRSGSGWSQLGSKLLVAGAVGASSAGTSVALSSDGTTAAVGGADDDSQLGAAWIFVRLCGHGDVNGDGAVNVNDVFYLINFLFAAGPAPRCV